MLKKSLLKKGKTFLILLFLIITACASDSRIDKNASVPSKITPEFLKKILDEKDKNYLLIDVRTPSEYKKGHIPSALLIPYDEIEKHTEEISKEKVIILYCHSGRRSGIALSALKNLGYKKLINFGGITNWTYPLEK